MATKTVLLGDSSFNWSRSRYILASNEIGLEIDTGKYKVGNDWSQWDDLEYAIPGLEGPSAYDIAVENGYVGTEQEWLDSLVGPAGPEGPEGPEGLQGPPGSDANVDSTNVAAAGAVLRDDTDAAPIQRIRSMTQAQYDVLPTPRDANTLFVIVPG